MSNNPRQAPAKCAPDCVTEVRMGNTILTVYGYFKQDTTETAADKMARVITAEAATGNLTRAAGKFNNVVSVNSALTTL